MMLSQYDDKNADVHFELGNLFMQDDNTTLATNEFNTCIKLNPRDKNPFLKLGDIFFRLYMNSTDYAPKEAQDYMKKSVDNYQKYVNLGGKKDEVPPDLRVKLK
jgi:hypothetical protein